MAIMNAYLVTTKNVDSFFNSLYEAEAPEKFTSGFLKQLDFTSSNDRLFIPVLRGLGFIDDAGVPTQRYFDYLDQSNSKRVLAESIKDAYSDLFILNKKAYSLTQSDIKGKLRSITQGKKSDNVLDLMSKTFVKLVELADWSSASQSVSEGQPQEQEEMPPKHTSTDTANLKSPDFHYNIQIHLPESRDPKVFDAIFRSLKDHLI